MRGRLQLMKLSGIRISCLVVAYMRLPLTWTKKDAMIMKERRGRHEHKGKVLWWQKGIGGDPRLWDHTSYSRKHGAVLSPTYTQQIDGFANMLVLIAMLNPLANLMKADCTSRPRRRYHQAGYQSITPP
jgi:hypothetical protein